MWSHVANAGVSLAKRAVAGGDDQPTYSLPLGTYIFVGIVFLLFVPLFVFTTYSVGAVYPVLAIIENPNPPAYEALSDEHDATLDGRDDESGLAAAPITSNLKRTFNVLFANGGWGGNFRGIFLAIVIAIGMRLLIGVFTFIPFVHWSLAGLLAAVAFVQFHTAWVHAVIRSDPAPMFRNLPPFRRTFEATSLPVLAAWAATAASTSVPRVIAGWLGLPALDASMAYGFPVLNAHMLWKLLIVVAVQQLLVFVVVIPTNAVLVRVQASLLPPDQNTVVPFDRSFGGAVEPLIVDGRGFATMRDAFRTFSRASWRRLLVLYGKVYAVILGLNFLFAIIVVPVIVVTAHEDVPSSSY